MVVKEGAKTKTKEEKKVTVLEKMVATGKHPKTGAVLNAAQMEKVKSTIAALKKGISGGHKEL